MNQIIDNIMRQIGEYTARHPDGDGQALRTAIEQALTPGEPVAIVVDVYDTPGLQWLCQHPPKRGDRLYTAPQPQPTTVACPSCGSTQVECAVCAAGFTAPQTQQWVGLTDEEVQAFVGAAWSRDVTPAHFIRAIEFKLREKNGGGAYSQDTHQPRVNTHQPCNPAEDGVCEALECCDHFPDAGKKVDDTALLRQALHALEYRGTSEWSEWEVRKPVIAALRERLKDVK